MTFRGVKPVGVAQMRFVQVPLGEWCLGRVVHSKWRVVNGINNSHDLNYLGQHQRRQIAGEQINIGCSSRDMWCFHILTKITSLYTIVLHVPVHCGV
jgi:hypothetical protein